MVRRQLADSDLQISPAGIGAWAIGGRGWAGSMGPQNDSESIPAIHIDLYRLHWPEPDEDIEEGWTELARLKDEGKVRYIGVSISVFPR